MDKGLWLRMTALCGTLDIVYAGVISVARGSTVADMLLSVASGPFGDAARGWGIGGMALGLATHFVTMAAMVGVGLWLLAKEPLAGGKAWKVGTLYGILLYFLMFGLVLQTRFGLPFPDPDRIRLALGLVPHIVFVGIPVALAAQGKSFRRKSRSS